MAKTAATRWGIVSAGNIASDFASAIRSCPKDEHEIVAVAARKLERAQAFAKKFSISKAYSSYVELAQDPNVEVAYVCPIHPHHAELTKLMLNHGKHVVCEKPLTMNSGQAREVVQLARDKGLFLMEAYWTRFFPAIADLKKELAAGTIGDVKVMTINFGHNNEATDRMHQKEMGGGALLDLGCYSVMFANLLFGLEKPQKIVASGTLLDSGVDQMVTIALHYSQSRLVNLNVTMNCLLDNVARIFGSKGVIEVPDFWHPVELITPNQKYTYEAPKPAFPVNYGCSEWMVYEVQGIRQSLLKGERESTVVPLDDSLWIMEIMDEVRRQIGVHYDADD